MLSINEVYPIDLESLDPGIRPYVEILRRENVHTFESCQGGEGHCMPDPTVNFHGDAYEGYRAFAVAMTYGMPVLQLSRYYAVEDGHLAGPHWQMTFKEPAS